MARRKFNLDTDQSHRWIVSYSDFITLLFAFFVVMYAVSTVNLNKYKEVISSLGSAFKKTPSKHQKQFLDPAQTVAKNHEQEQFDITNRTVSNAIKKPVLGKDVIVRQNKQWTEIEFKTRNVFANGTANILPEAKAKLRIIAQSLVNTDHPIVVEGHTDSIPMKSQQFPSNWELSAARSASVARLLVADGVSPAKLSAVAYSDQHPVKDNTTAAGRAANRRVVIVIARNKNVARLLNPHLHKQAKLITKNGTQDFLPVVNIIRTKTGGLKFTRGTKPAKQSKIEE